MPTRRPQRADGDGASDVFDGGVQGQWPVVDRGQEVRGQGTGGAIVAEPLDQSGPHGGQAERGQVAAVGAGTGGPGVVDLDHGGHWPVVAAGLAEVDGGHAHGGSQHTVSLKNGLTVEALSWKSKLTRLC
jgi:hypothetical protein